MIIQEKQKVLSCLKCILVLHRNEFFWCLKQLEKNMWLLGFFFLSTSMPVSVVAHFNNVKENGKTCPAGPS